MATQSHYVRLIRIVKILNCIKQDSEILAFSPMGTVCTKEINQDLVISNNEQIACAACPTYIHRRWPKVDTPCVLDVLADVGEDGLHCEDLSFSRSYQEAVSEQGVFFKSAKGG